MEFCWPVHFEKKKGFKDAVICLERVDGSKNVMRLRKQLASHFCVLWR